jgi:hypothetical protein
LGEKPVSISSQLPLDLVLQRKTAIFDVTIRRHGGKKTWRQEDMAARGPFGSWAGAIHDVHLSAYRSQRNRA